jgi:serine/threonine protein kinase
MPPERAASPIVAKTTDIYQAGMTLYRMCVGNEELNRQFAAYSSKQALIDAITCGEFPNRNRRLAHVPVRLHKIVKTAMAENPTKRYQTVLELMNALAQVDEALDWAYAENGFWGDGTWHHSDGSRGRRVELMQTNGNWAVKATRRSATGREARFSVFSSTGLNERDARKLVSRALTQPWH